MNTNRNSETKKAMEATSSSMNPPLSAQGRGEGRQGGRLLVGSGGNTPNNHTSNTRTPSSSLSSPVTPSTGIVTENGSCQNALMTMVSPPPPVEAAAAAAAAEAQPPSIPDPQDECVLCCYPLPLKRDESVYKVCCGEVICYGCIIAQRRTLIIGMNVKKPIKGSTEEELEFKTILCAKLRVVCPFCRARSSKKEELLKRLHTRINKYKDPIAMRILGTYYNEGEYGLSKNPKKAEELLKRSYDLGDPTAAIFLAELYSEHIPDQARELKCLEEGARRGNCFCMRILACKADRSGNYKEVKRLSIAAACSGDDQAMYNLMEYFPTPSNDIKTTRHAHKAANDKVKSEPREYAMRYKVFQDNMFTARKLLMAKGVSLEEATRLIEEEKTAVGNVVLL